MSEQLAMLEAPVVAIFEAIRKRTGISFEEMAGRSRVQQIVHARYLAMFFLRLEAWEFRAIGKHFNRHHTSVIWACSRVPKEAEYTADLVAIRAALPPRSEAAS